MGFPGGPQPGFHLKKESFSPRSGTPTYSTTAPLGPPPPSLSSQAPNPPDLSEFYQPPASTPFPQFVHGGAADAAADFLAATAEPPPPPGLGGCPGEGGGTLPAPLQGALQGALGLLHEASSSMRPPLQSMPRHSASSRGGHHSSDLHKVSDEMTDVKHIHRCVKLILPV